MKVTLNDTSVAMSSVDKLSYAPLPNPPEGRLVLSTDHSLEAYILSPTDSVRYTRHDSNTIEIESVSHPLLIWNPEDATLPRYAFFPQPSTDTQSGEYVSVTELGVLPGSKLQTAEIQSAIDSMAVKGGVIAFPAGLYRTGTLNMRSHVKLYLETNAVMQGSTEPEDYPLDAGYREQGTNGELMTFSRLILFDSVSDSGIYGPGTIQGGGIMLRQKGRAANLIRIKNSHNVPIEDVILTDATAWTIHVLYSDTVAVKNVKILNNIFNRNTDGVDPDSSRNVTVEGCFMYCNDDCVVVKTTRNSSLLRPCENVLARNNIFFTLKAAQKLGTESCADIRHIRFENNYIIAADRAVALYNFDGGHFDDISFINTKQEHVRLPEERKIENRNGIGTIGKVTIK